MVGGGGVDRQVRIITVMDNLGFFYETLQFGYWLNLHKILNVAHYIFTVQNPDFKHHSFQRMCRMVHKYRYSVLYEYDADSMQWVHYDYASFCLCKPHGETVSVDISIAMGLWYWLIVFGIVIVRADTREPNKNKNISSLIWYLIHACHWSLNL